MLPQIFNYQNSQIRVAIIDDEPWWVAKDVCDILNLSNTTEAVRALDDDEKTTLRISEGGPEVNVINEAGLYSLIIRSNKPEARQFKRWITHEVIPQIRATGSYQYNPQKLISLALVEAQKILAEKDEQIAVMAPKADFFDQVASSKDAIDLGSAAKVLNMGIGRNRLFEILREEKVLMSNNQPYQTFIDRGYFRTIEQKYTVPSGETRISIKTLVYQKGLNYIRQVIEKEKPLFKRPDKKP